MRVKFLCVVLMLLAVPTAAFAAGDSPEETVTWFVEAYTGGNEEAMLSMLADSYACSVWLPHINEYLARTEEECITGIRTDWEFSTVIDVQWVRNRLDESTDSQATVTAFWDQWERDDFGVFGPVRRVMRFELLNTDASWLIQEIVFME